MKAGPKQFIATWLVGAGVAGLLTLAQTPANAASSELPPAHIVELIEEAAPEGADREIVRFWFSNPDVVNVIIQIGGRPHEFKVSAAAGLLWMGAPGGNAPPAPFVTQATGPISFAAAPDAVRQRVFQIAPEFAPLSVELVPARTPFYRMVGESDRGRVHLSLKNTGALVDFDIDGDRDGLGDAFELSRGWDPHLADSDGDGFPDGFEFSHLGDPGKAEMHPQLLSVRHDREGDTLVARLSTFEGAAFFLETPAPDGNGWWRIGEAIRGDGSEHEFAIPLGGGAPGSLLVRAGMSEDPNDGIDTGEALPGSGDQCSVPANLVGRELTVSGGHRLCFKSGTRGEELMGGGGGLLVTPFAYTFRRAGHCQARLTVNFNTPAGIETTVYTLTFGADGSASGAFASRSFIGGAPDDETGGIFSFN